MISIVILYSKHLMFWCDLLLLFQKVVEHILIFNWDQLPEQCCSKFVFSHLIFSAFGKEFSWIPSSAYL